MGAEEGGGSKRLIDLVLRDLRGFVSNYFVNEAGLPVVLTPYQERFIYDVLSGRGKRFVFLASTRAGKTEATAILGTLRAILFDGEEVVLIAPWYKQVERMFKRIRNYFLSNHSLMRLVDFSRGFRRDEINLRNGSIIRSLSAANPEGLLGHGATFLVVDEVGSIPDDVIKSRILRMLAGARARGKEPVLVLLGTPHKLGFLYEAWNSPEFIKYRVTWREAVDSGIMSADEVEYARRTMSEDEFRVWYEAEFLNIEGGLFSPNDVLRCMYGSLKHVPEAGFDYFAGLDIARFGDDETALVIVRLPHEATIDEYPVELVWYKTRSKRSISDTVGWVLDVINRWGVRAIAVDEVGLGGGAVDFLREKLGGYVYGIHMTGEARRDVYLNLREMLEEGQLILPKNDDFLKRQFMNYSVTYGSDGKVKIVKGRSGRDDVVDALALACYLVKKHRGGSLVEYVGDFMKL